MSGKEISRNVETGVMLKYSRVGCNYCFDARCTLSYCAVRYSLSMAVDNVNSHAFVMTPGR